MKGSPDSSRGGVRGFTLVEIMVVLFIISVVMAVVLPSFAVSDGKLRAEARTVASTLRYFNEMSALKRKTLPLKFDLDEKTLSWANLPDVGGERTESLESLRAVELQTTGMVEEGELTVFFTPLGLGQDMTVYLSRNDKSMAVALSYISGRVRIHGEDEL